MDKMEGFLNSERERYGKLFVDINYAIDNVSPFLEKQDLSNRKYITKLPVLKKYMELLDSAERDNKKEGFFSKLFNNDKYTGLLESYKADNLDNFNQLEKCSKCACLNCTATCKFDSCLGCRPGSKIVYCDHEKINATFHDNYILNLTNDRTGTEDRYKVLATLQDCELDRKYIIIQSLMSKDEKFILYYYPGISEDNFGEISDEQEFDFIASVYESINK